MLQALTWLLAIEVITLAAAPFAFVAFSRLPDRGLSLAKPFGLLLLGYPLWLLGSLHILPHSAAGILALIAVMAVAALFLTRWRALEIRQHLRQHWRVIVLTEAVFLVFFVGWVIYRSYDPDITSTEKPMDFAFLNANMAATYFPPEDPWLRGLPISYYYMGYMLWGALAKLTGVASGAAYSLALALVAGMAGAAAFGLSYNLLRLARVAVPRAMVAALSAPALLPPCREPRQWTGVRPRPRLGQRRIVELDRRQGPGGVLQRPKPHSLRILVVVAVQSRDRHPAFRLRRRRSRLRL